MTRIFNFPSRPKSHPNPDREDQAPETKPAEIIELYRDYRPSTELSVKQVLAKIGICPQVVPHCAPNDFHELEQYQNRWVAGMRRLGGGEATLSSALNVSHQNIPSVLRALMPGFVWCRPPEGNLHAANWGMSVREFAKIYNVVGRCVADSANFHGRWGIVMHPNTQYGEVHCIPKQLVRLQNGALTNMDGEAIKSPLVLVYAGEWAR